MSKINNSILSKNQYILYRGMYNANLHNAIMDKDIAKIETIIDQFTRDHLKYYDFSLYDSNTFIDIDYVYAEHIKQIEEDNNSLNSITERLCN